MAPDATVPAESAGVKPVEKSGTKKTIKATNKRHIEGDDVEDPSSKTVWKYAEFRTEYIRLKMKDGYSHKESCNLWDESLEKAKLLANVSIGELKRRKFLKKGADENPWWNKIQNVGNSSSPQ